MPVCISSPGRCGGSCGGGIISRGPVAIGPDPPGLDSTTVQIDGIPPQPHHFGAAESAECQPPRRGPLVLIGRGPELDQLERLPHSHRAERRCVAYEGASPRPPH